MKKKALIFGITGQTGSYLAELLLSKNYIVHGIRRRTSTFYDTVRLESLINFQKHINKNFYLHYGDITDSISSRNIINKILPDEIYNLAAQSHVQVSFELPKYTTEVNALGVINILESIRALKKNIKFYQASTSELFGNIKNENFLHEKSKMEPVSPYGVSKLFSFFLVKHYRSAYNIFASNGILFNHESPLRGEHFVTKKITKGISRIYYRLQKKVQLGNLNAIRDWGHAKDYAVAIWKILQLNKPIDITVSSGNAHSVREFIKECFSSIKIPVKFLGTGHNEKVVDDTGKVWIEVNKKYIRPQEIDFLRGNPVKTKKILKWKPDYNFYSLVKEMMDHDLNEASIELRNHVKKK
jgi:GDPmannose 4,6-dehydratase